MRPREDRPGDRIVDDRQLGFVAGLRRPGSGEQRVGADRQAFDHAAITAAGRIVLEIARDVPAVQHHRQLRDRRARRGRDLDQRLAAAHELGPRRQRPNLEQRPRLHPSAAAALGARLRPSDITAGGQRGCGDRDDRKCSSHLVLLVEIPVLSEGPETCNCNSKLKLSTFNFRLSTNHPRSFPAKDFRGERHAHDADDRQRREVADVRRPRRSRPDPLQQRHGVGQRQQRATTCSAGGSASIGTNRPDSADHRIEDDRCRSAARSARSARGWR